MRTRLKNKFSLITLVVSYCFILTKVIGVFKIKPKCFLQFQVETISVRKIILSVYICFVFILFNDFNILTLNLLFLDKNKLIKQKLIKKSLKNNRPGVLPLFIQLIHDRRLSMMDDNQDDVSANSISQMED